MMDLWLVPVLLFLLLLLVLFFRRTAGNDVNVRDARERADLLRHGDEDR